jgi:hypothetical protein
MAKKHDAEQKKKNDGGDVEVARKFMNYIEYGMYHRQASLMRFLENEGFEGWVYG